MTFKNQKLTFLAANPIAATNTGNVRSAEVSFKIVTGNLSDLGATVVNHISLYREEKGVPKFVSAKISVTDSGPVINATIPVKVKFSKTDLRVNTLYRKYWAAIYVETVADGVSSVGETAKVTLALPPVVR